MKTLILVILLLISTAGSAEEIYRLETKIADHVFYDLMVIESKDLSGKDMKGSITVPGHFTSPMVNGIRSINYLSIKYNFEILVKENGQQYKVTYSLVEFYKDSGVIKGSLYKDNDYLGEVKGNKIFESDL
jgi:hypothetical protein